MCKDGGFADLQKALEIHVHMIALFANCAYQSLHGKISCENKHVGLLIYRRLADCITKNCIGKILLNSSPFNSFDMSVMRLLLAMYKSERIWFSDSYYKTNKLESKEDKRLH